MCVCVYNIVLYRGGGRVSSVTCWKNFFSLPVFSAPATPIHLPASLVVGNEAENLGTQKPSLSGEAGGRWERTIVVEDCRRENPEPGVKAARS